jgi:predicted dehydrogenase
MVKLGVLGTGIITECHFFALDRIGGARMAAVASLDEASGKGAAQKYGAAYYRDYKELLDAEKDLDGVIVALPNHMHYEACVYAIGAGHKMILCEKPLCTNSADSKKLTELANRNGVLLQTGYMKRFNPGFRQIRDALGVLGEIEFVTSAIYVSAPVPEVSGRQEPTAWHSDPTLSGGGFLTHSGSHHIDLLRHLFGDVKSVACKCRYDREDGRDYFVDGTLGMESGVDIAMKMGRADVPNLGPSWQPFRGGWNESIEVIATKGYIKVDNPSWQGYEAMKVTRWLSGMPGPETEYYECNEQWINELSAFAESCGTGALSADGSSAADGYRVDLIIERMRESGRQGGRPIEIIYEC